METIIKNKNSYKTISFNFDEFFVGKVSYKDTGENSKNDLIELNLHFDQIDEVKFNKETNEINIKAYGAWETQGLMEFFRLVSNEYFKDKKQLTK